MTPFAKRLLAPFVVEGAPEPRKPETWKSILARILCGLVGWTVGAWAFQAIRHRPLDVNGVTGGAVCYVVATLAVGWFMTRRETSV